MVDRKDKELILIFVMILGICLISLGITYAYWILTRQQTGGATVLGQIV